MKTFFRVVSFLEGTSYLLLLFVAVPIKYWMNDPQYVKLLGMPHGLLFVGYLIAFKIINYFSSEKIIFYDGLLAILIVGLAAILYQLFRNKAYIYDSIIILLIWVNPME